MAIGLINTDLSGKDDAYIIAHQLAANILMLAFKTMSPPGKLPLTEEMTKALLSMGFEKKDLEERGPLMKALVRKISKERGIPVLQPPDSPPASSSLDHIEQSVANVASSVVKASRHPYFPKELEPAPRLPPEFKKK